MIDSVNLEDVICPFGCSKNDEVVLTGHDRFHDMPGEYTVVKCCKCGLMRTNPRPSQETIAVYYPDDYSPYLGTRVQQPSSLRMRLKPLFRLFFNFNTEKLPKLNPGRLLEVGCASGSFLYRMARQGWQVEGIEFSGTAAQVATQLGYSVHAGPLETAPVPQEPFDLIVAWMVLEHLHDPIGGLIKLRECSKPGTWLVLSVPNAGSLSFRFFKEEWYDLHLPNHLYHFTPETLTRALSAGGWSLEKIYHQRVLNNLIASTGYILRNRGYAKIGQKFIDFPTRVGLWIYAFYPFGWLLSLFGQTGRMTVWARIDGAQGD